MDNRYLVLLETLTTQEKKYFSTYLDSLTIGDKVIVETFIGEELAVVLELPKVLESSSKEEKGYDRVLRVCTNSDCLEHSLNCEKTKLAKVFFNKATSKLKLNMQLVDVKYNLDTSKLLFLYTSERRIDFRELLKELSTEFKCRIELKQIGPRDRAKIVGGIGVCGLPLCCNNFLSEFEGISINMAKNQMLALNTNKISGHCTKLLCCLKFEDDNYTKYKKLFPTIGSKVKFKNKNYQVAYINIVSDTIKLESFDRSDDIYITLEEFSKK